jgi:YesN/AraC family two-component response regulator
VLIVEDEAKVREWLAQQSTVADLIP